MFTILAQLKPEHRHPDNPTFPGNEPQVLDRIEAERVADRWVIEYQRRYGFAWNVWKEAEPAGAAQ